MTMLRNAVQCGDHIVITNEYGSVIREITGIMISFSSGKLVYKSGSSTITTFL